MASNPLTSECRRFSLENAHVGAAREDLAFRPNHQGSERSLLCRSHGASQVFNELLAEQVQGRIRQREYPESARGLEAHLFIHHCLHRRKIDSIQTDHLYGVNSTLPPLCAALVIASLTWSKSHRLRFLRKTANPSFRCPFHSLRSFV